MWRNLKILLDKAAVPSKQLFLLMLSDTGAATVTSLSHWHTDALLSWGIHSEEFALQWEAELIFLY